MTFFARLTKFCLVMVSIPAWAACTTVGTTLTAASCSVADIQACTSIATNSTTLITVPAGTCHWTSQLLFTVPSGSANLSIIGAGSLTTQGGNDQTIIVDDYASSNSDWSIVTANPSSIFRMAGITFQGGIAGTGNDKYTGMLGIGGLSQNVRLDHMHFNTTTYSPALASAGARITGCVWGVADHDIVDNSLGSVNNGIQEWNGGNCYQLAADTIAIGDSPWTVPTPFGSLRAFYLENDTFNNGVANDCTMGGSFVIRYSQFNMSAPAPSAQTHPTTGGRIRGCRWLEVYNNGFTASNYIDTGIWISSGAAIIWGNSFPAGGTGPTVYGYKQAISLHSMRRDNGSYGEGVPPHGWGYCGTSSGLPGDGSNWDGGNTSSTGYPCLDQPGRGQGDLLTGGFVSDGSGSDNVTNNATGCNYSSACAYPRQLLDPIYEWGDLQSPVPQNPSVMFGINGTFTENVDFYKWCSTGVLGGNTCTTFDGTQGTGTGFLANRPTTCTPGVVYWATDQGNWDTVAGGVQGLAYKCGPANTWTLFYTPATYPHPLISGSTVTNYNLTITSLNGSVTGTNCVTGSYPAGTLIGPCTAVPLTGYSFSNWSSVTGSATCSGSTNPCPQFAINANSGFTPIFTGNNYTLSTQLSGNGTGTITGCAGPHGFFVPYTCTLSPGTNSVLTGVTGCNGSGTFTYSGNMPASNCTVIATFAHTTNSGITPQIMISKLEDYETSHHLISPPAGSRPPVRSVDYLYQDHFYMGSTSRNNPMADAVLRWNDHSGRLRLRVYLFSNAAKRNDPNYLTMSPRCKLRDFGSPMCRQLGY